MNNPFSSITGLFSGKQQQPIQIGNMTLAREADKTRVKSMLIELAMQSQALTKKDIKTWRNAWQVAMNVENPQRMPLYSIYTDAMIDLHLTGCIGQRTGKVKQKSFKLVGKDGNENEEATKIFEAQWFKDFMDYVLESNYWGHSLIQLGDVIERNGKMGYSNTLLVPRQHVKPEFGVIIKDQGDEPSKGYDYRNSAMADWCIEAGKPRNLGLLLQVVPQTISKKNMLAFWDQFGELFGMPIRIGKTTTRDEKERSKIEAMLDGMGAAAWGLFPEGTEIEIKETTRGDAYNVYDQRVIRANSEISKGILHQTMTIDNGASLSQSQVHQDIFEDVVDLDADNVKDIVNDQLIPRMINHGFKLKGLSFDWDEQVDYTPEEQISYETMLADRFEIDPEYFIKKYNVPIIGKKATTDKVTLSHSFFD